MKAPALCGLFLLGLATGALFFDWRASLGCMAGAYGCFLLAWIEHADDDKVNRAARYVLARDNRIDGLTVLDLDRACETLDLASGPREILTVEEFLAEVLR